ncbi:MAG TPA: trehalose-phosphatase [Thermoanaerobaculia bacterium]|nr:trehalose-phosphatase [Thermoanaerobaculia bacterium]
MPDKLTKDPGSTLLLATDFDGTIARITPRPDDAFIEESAFRLLEECASSPSIVLAVVSGRDVDDVRFRLGGVPAIVAGSHGHECVDAHGRMLWSAPRVIPDLDAGLLVELTLAGLLIEPKKFSVALHYRGREPDDLAPLLSRFARWAGHNGLDLLPGRKVVEARVPGGGKRAAIRAIAGLVQARRVIYAGDDRTDFEALALAAERGSAIFVRSSERNPPAIEGLQVVATVDGLCAALRSEIGKPPRAPAPRFSAM